MALSHPVVTPLLFYNISQLVLPVRDISHLSDASILSVVTDGAILVVEGVILASGLLSDVKKHPLASVAKAVNLNGRAVLPGLVDSHTHLVFGGDRIHEMSLRASGATYEEIATQGGGIRNSVADLQNDSVEALVAQSLPRINHMARRGVTTVEIKTGYGLEPQLELKQLEAIEQLAAQTAVSVYKTALAHVVPTAYQGNVSYYIQHWCESFLEPAVDRIDYCDIFIESGAFSIGDARTIVKYAKKLQLPMKLHVDQLRNGQGAQFAAEINALSADHLEFISSDGAQSLAQSQTVATILPGCKLFLGKGPWPPARLLREHGCDVAIATDCNPGSSMVSDLPLCAMMAVTLCGLSMEEAIWGITAGGAKALGLNDRGTLAAGERADFIVLNHQDYRSLLYFAAAPVGSCSLQAVSESTHLESYILGERVV